MTTQVLLSIIIIVTKTLTVWGLAPLYTTRRVLDYSITTVNNTQKGGLLNSTKWPNMP